MSEPITDVAEAVAALGALPVPAGSEPQPDRVPHDSPLHHSYTTPHDMPQTAVTRDAEGAAVCRCDEPGADPYECEAEDCSGHFSELNPFAGARPVDEPSAEVSRKCGQCGWRTSVWHVDDGSAEEELHGHVVRVHGGGA